MKRLKQIKDKNKEAYYKRNPDQYPSSKALITRCDVNRLRMHNPTDFESSATLRKPKFKIEIISLLMKLFFTILKEG